MLVFLLALYATLLSALWLGVAIYRPRFGTYIMDGGRLAPSTATTLTAALAKSIELSFVAAFIAFIGQYLSRRALSKHRGGMTVSDMMLRTAVLQPGAVLVHFRDFLASAGSRLGLLSILACVAAMLYTTASETLVAPKLTLPLQPVPQPFFSHKLADFVNYKSMGNRCSSSLVSGANRLGDEPCFELESTSQSYHNYLLL